MTCQYLLLGSCHVQNEWPSGRKHFFFAGYVYLPVFCPFVCLMSKTKAITLAMPARPIMRPRRFGLQAYTRCSRIASTQPRKSCFSVIQCDQCAHRVQSRKIVEAIAYKRNVVVMVRGYAPYFPDVYRDLRTGPGGAATHTPNYE